MHVIYKKKTWEKFYNEIVLPTSSGLASNDHDYKIASQVVAKRKV